MVRTERGRDRHRIDTVDGTAIYRDERAETYHASVSFDRPDPVVTTLLSLVSRATDRDRFALSPLSDAIEPDALERLLTHWRRRDVDSTGTLSFSYERCAVTLDESGEIVVDPLATE